MAAYSVTVSGVRIVEESLSQSWSGVKRSVFQFFSKREKPVEIEILSIYILSPVKFTGVVVLFPVQYAGIVSPFPAQFAGVIGRCRWRLRGSSDVSSGVSFDASSHLLHRLA